jgi:CIC family chloride channel protein
MVLVAILCGLAGGFGAIGFRALIKLFQELFFGTGGALVAAALALPWYWRLLAPAIGGLFVGPMGYFFSAEAKGHGVPEVMESVALKGGTIPPRTVALRSLASALCIGSGGSVGREGPIVQIGSALSSTIGQLLKVSTRQLRTLVGAGAAAGMAATFNAPIAGALFAVEVILGDFGVPQFSPIVISSVVATVVSRHFLGDFPAFEVPQYHLVSPFELAPYMVVGALAGLVALTFIVVLYATEDFFERLRLPGYSKAVLGGLLVGTIGIWLPNVFGVGYDTINAALNGTLPATLLFALLLAKISATSITVGSGGSGGVFAPSLFLGAMTGGFLGTFIHQWFPESTATSGAYALVAMGAVVAGVTHAPITAIIMIFELTGDYTIIPPLMAACVVSTLLVTRLKRDSIYTLKLRRRGIDIFKEEDPNVLRSLYVHDIIDRDPEVIPASAGFLTVLDLVVRSRHTEFFVVNNKGDLLGAISLSELRRLIFEQEALRHVVVAGDLVLPDPPSVTENDTLDVVMQLFSHGEMDEIPVVDVQNPKKLIGTVHKRDVINAYNQEVLRRDLAGTMSSTVALVSKVRQVEVGNGYVVQETQAPRSFVGRTLRQLNVRARYGIQVVFIRSRDGEAGEPKTIVPTPDYRIHEGDALIVAGPKEQVDALEEL